MKQKNTREKRNRNLDAEKTKRQLALSRLMFWSFQIGEFKQKYEQNRHIQHKNYTEFISLLALSKNITDIHHLHDGYPLTLETDYAHTRLMPFLLFQIYYLESNLNPWGIATITEIKRKIVHQGKTIRLSRLPNFLLPCECLYCGESLGFKTYRDTAYNITKHPECSNLWDKNIRRKHLVAQDILHSLGASGDKTQVEAAFDSLWDSYKELSVLFDRDYSARYTLIDTYKDIPNNKWAVPYVGIEPRDNILELPFLEEKAREFGLASSEEEDGMPLRWNEFNPETMKPAITLSELETYFIKNPV